MNRSSLLLAATLLAGCASNSTSTRDAHPVTGDGARLDRGVAADTIEYSGAFGPGTGLSSASLTVAGEARKVELYRPSGAGAGAALLITFHGTNDDARKMIDASAAKSLADKEGLVVLSPWARKQSGGDWDNHTGSETYWETHPNVDPAKNKDLLLVRALIAEARRAYKVDPRRVYLLGHSNGGFFSLLAAMTLRDRVAAFASNSSGLVRCGSTAGCKFTGKGATCDTFAKQPGYCSCSGVSKPGPVPGSGPKVAGFLSHGDDDSTVSVYYTCALAAEMKAKGHPVKVFIEQGLGHGMPFPLALTAWDFISGYKLQ